MPGGRGKIKPEDNPKPFSSTYQPLNTGRKPKVFTQIAREFKEAGLERATPDIVQEAYEYLLALPMSEVTKIAWTTENKEENDLPSMYRLVAKEMIGRRSQEMIQEMLNRAHGKPKQVADVTSNGETLNSGFHSLPVEKQAEILRILNSSNDHK